MALLGGLWRMTQVGGVLLLGSPVMDDPLLSQYAVFVGGDDDEESGWLPGRLLLRWMVRPLASNPTTGLSCCVAGGPAVLEVYLRAVRTERPPPILPS